MYVYLKIGDYKMISVAPAQIQIIGKLLLTCIEIWGYINPFSSFLDLNIKYIIKVSWGRGFDPRHFHKF